MRRDKSESERAERRHRVEVIQLSERDSLRVLALLEEPPPPSPRLIAAARRRLNRD